MNDLVLLGQHDRLAEFYEYVDVIQQDFLFKASTRQEVRLFLNGISHIKSDLSAHLFHIDQSASLLCAESAICSQLRIMTRREELLDSDILQDVKSLESDIHSYNAFLNNPDETPVAKMFLLRRMKERRAAIEAHMFPEKSNLFRPLNSANSLLKQVCKQYEFGGAFLFSITSKGLIIYFINYQSQSFKCKIFPAMSNAAIYAFLSEHGGWFSNYSIFCKRTVSTSEETQNEGIERWNEYLTFLLDSLWNQFGEWIYDTLKEANINRKTPVHLIAPGSLSMVPLHAVSNDTDILEEKKSLIDWNIIYAPCLESLAKSDKPSPKSENILSVKNSKDDFRYIPNPVLPAFQNAAVFDIAKHDLSKLPDAMRDSDHVCFFCHGEWSYETPDKSGLKLGKNHVLTMDQIHNIAFSNKPLIFLAACETALSELTEAPNELYGLPLALINAGAGSVIGSLWPINASFAEAFVALFYKNIKSGMPYQEAFRETVLKAKDSKDNDLLNDLDVSDLTHWAAFKMTIA